MNRIFFALVVIAVAFAGWFEITWSPPETEQGTAIAGLSSDRAMVVGYSGASTFDGTIWLPQLPPSTVRRDAALAPLDDGGALLVGGRAATRGLLSTLRRIAQVEDLQPTGAAERFNALRERWESVDPLPVALIAPHTITLSDGSVVVLGGHDGEQALDHAFRFDPTAGMWERLPSMPEPRAQAAVARMGEDWVVVGGVRDGGALATSTLVYRATERVWQTYPGPRMPRVGHELVPEPDGSLLLVGGENPEMGLLPTAERLDPQILTWSVAGHLAQGRVHAAASEIDGSVVVAGGTDARGTPLVTTEALQDGRWTGLRPLADPRVGARAVSAGGALAVVGGGQLGASMLDVDRGTWNTVKPASPMESLGMGIIDSAGAAVTLAIGLIGVMTLFLGLMKVGEAGGLLAVLAKLIRPLMVRLFPDVPAEHPAMGAMVLNMSANALGLGNAATPFGIRAMEELEKLNERPGTATNAMALFLAINTSNVTILPTGVIALRAATGSVDPGGILVTTLFATICSTAVAITASKTLQRFYPLGPVPESPAVPEGADPSDLEAATAAEPAAASATAADPVDPPDADADADALPGDADGAYPGWVTALALTALFSLIPLAILPWTRGIIESAVPWLIPLIVLGLLAFGFFRNVPVYEVFVGGARDGFQVAVRIIPFLVGILVAIGMFRASGALSAFVSVVGPWTSAVGLPGEALPMALLRPLSGSGAYGVLVSIIADPAVGPDSYTGYLVSTFQGSTETTFYVLAVYFGAVGIKRIRHAMFAALTADLAGVIAAVIICTLLYG